MTANSPRSMARPIPRLTAAIAATATAAFGLVLSPATAADDLVSVIVREVPGAGDLAERTVALLGGVVTGQIGLINGFVADVPAGTEGTLASVSEVIAVTPNAEISPLAKPGKDDGGTTTTTTTQCTSNKRSSTYFAGTDYCALDDMHSMANLTRYVKAKNVWNLGITGKGIDVAVIDTGVNDDKGLVDKVLYGADVSFDGWDPEFSQKDKMGHGTHLASIIAGRDEGVPQGLESDYRATHFLGVAPDARIVSVKAGDRNGVVDVSQVLAALDWTVQNRTENGANIRVINLAFGTNGTQSHVLDPLAYAVEVAWRKGIVVVTSAGNSGAADGRLVNPAQDPLVLAIGANDTNGTFETDDDVIPSWSSRGDGIRNPDLVAPGRSIAGLLSSNATAGKDNPDSVVAEGRLIRGSGTSQSAAVVSGIVALILEAYPAATPDQVKELLIRTAQPLPAADPRAQGAGMVDALAAIEGPLPTILESVQAVQLATGLGTLEGARGDVHVTSEDGVDLIGEMDVTGSTWAGSTWAGSTWAGSTWAGSNWAGSTWASQGWLGLRWN